MTIEYRMIENVLTEPSSFYAQVEPKDVFEIEQVSLLIHNRNPTITASIAQDVLESFAAEVMFQFLEGNTVNIEGFCSFRMSLPISLSSSTDPLPLEPVNAVFVPSVVIKDQLKVDARYERQGYNYKEPVILSATDTNFDLAGYIKDNNPFQLIGSDLGYDATDPEQGIFLTNQNVTMRQTNVALNDPSKLIFVPDLAAFPLPQRYEYEVILKTRYTENGNLRTLTNDRRVRAIETLDADDLFMRVEFLFGGPVRYTTYEADSVDCIIVAYISPFGEVYMKVAGMDKVFGPSVQVTQYGLHIELEGLEKPLGLTIINLPQLIENCISYNRYLQQVCHLSGHTECVGLPPLVWAPANPELVDPASSITLEVTDGKLPIIWSIQGTGTGYSFAGGATVVEGGRSIQLFATLEVCGEVTVSADDECSDISGLIRYTGSVEFSGTNPTEIDPGSAANFDVELTTGLPDFTYSLVGEGYTFFDGSQLLVSSQRVIRVELSSEACSNGVLTVADACSQVSTDIGNTRLPVVFDPDGYDVEPDSSVVASLGAGTGVPPFTYSLVGEGYTFANGTQLFVDSQRVVQVNLALEACSNAVLTVSDSCSQASTDITNTRLPVAFPTAEATVPPGVPTNITLTPGAGMGTFVYTLTGVGYTFANGTQEIIYTQRVVQVNLAAGACPGGVLTVSDDCSQTSIDLVCP